jgi:hypothetical protein
MPPRFAYWTILIDNGPTAFRARDAHELLPTLNQLKRTNRNVVMRWFSGGTLWESPEAAREARRKPKARERRGPEWRPGGQHKDPRARFAKKKRSAAAPRDRQHGARSKPFRPPTSAAPGFRSNKPFDRKRRREEPPEGE